MMKKLLTQLRTALRVTINNPRLVQIEEGHFHIDLVADRDANEIFSHFAGDMGENVVSIGQCHTEHCTGKYLRHFSHQFNWLFFRHDVVEAFRVAIIVEKINFFARKKWTNAAIRLDSSPP